MNTETNARPEGALPLSVRVAARLRRFVDFIGACAAWLIIPVVVITCIDVIGRKLAYEDDDGRVYRLQMWLAEKFGAFFESTILQELEWHFHAALFALVLGYGVVHNTHVRIDLIREHLEFRKKAWLELIGLSLFMIPFCAIVIYFGFDYTYSSYLVKEASNSTVGLSHRWIIKGILLIGLITATLAGIAVWLQVALLLWGSGTKRFPLMTLEWPDEAGTRIEGKDRIVLDDMPGVQAPSTAVPVAAAKPAG